MSALFKRVLWIVLTAAVITFNSGAVPMTFASSGNIVVIGHPNLPINSISKTDLKNIFTGRKIAWSGDETIVVVILKKSKTHDRFLSKYVNKTSSQFRSYWIRLVFSGKGVAPISLASEEDMVDYVSNTKGAIGYISSNTNNTGTKIISVE